MPRRQDFRRIGLLVPSSSSVQEQDFCRVLPKDITLHVARMRLSNVEADSTLRIVQEIEVESQKLADVDVDVIIFPATAPSSRLGIGYDQELIKRISAASGKPATTASTALLESLRVLSIKTAVLGAPWSAPVNQTVAAFIEANGVKVLAQETLGFVRNLEIGLLDPQTALDVGRRRRTLFDEEFGESASAATSVDPFQAQGSRQPIEKNNPHPPAPISHIPLIREPVVEADLRFSHHCLV
jgi:maleate cis-trans isomerase